MSSRSVPKAQKVGLDWTEEKIMIINAALMLYMLVNQIASQILMLKRCISLVVANPVLPRPRLLRSCLYTWLVLSGASGMDEEAIRASRRNSPWFWAKGDTTVRGRRRLSV